MRKFCLLLALCVSSACSVLHAQNPSATDDAANAVESVNREALYEHFKKTLSGVKLVGRFTILGKDDGPLPKEEYTINSVTKQPEGDYWLFKTRIKYGAKDVTVPLPLEVKWADDTPIISLTDFTIPGMGTFSARVVIYNNKYAGTWKHGKAGGHLFGVIEKLEASTESGSAE